MKAIVNVTLKQGVLDPQGKAVHEALKSLGFGAVKEVRQGKLIELNLFDMDEKQALISVKEMCEQLLANTVIENYHIELRTN